MDVSKFSVGSSPSSSTDPLKSVQSSLIRVLHSAHPASGVPPSVAERITPERPSEILQRITTCSFENRAGRALRVGCLRVDVTDRDLYALLKVQINGLKDEGSDDLRQTLRPGRLEIVDARIATHDRRFAKPNDGRGDGRGTGLVGTILAVPWASCDDPADASSHTHLFATVYHRAPIGALLTARTFSPTE